MQFGIREVCDLDFKKRSGIGPDRFSINTAKMSTLEGSTTTVYAQGGQGNSRLAAWEGEKNLTFTVEDALMSLESLSALMGTTIDTSEENHKKFSITSTSFAGYYEITAKTLFREIETGEDCPTEIYIPNAKLQTTINIPMASTGDPATFTFTFDAFPYGQDKTLCTIDIETGKAEEKTEEIITTVIIYPSEAGGNAEKLEVAGTYPYLSVDFVNENYRVVLEGKTTQTTNNIASATSFKLSDGNSQFSNKLLKPGYTYYFTKC